MKKLYFLLLSILISTASFGQTPIITAIVDGDCTGGTPKVLEIYANGTVNFANYSLQNQTNGNTTWENTLSLASLGEITDGFVYIVYSSDLTIFNAEFPSATSNIISGVSVMSVNGDDRLRIIKDSDSSVIDQYGVSDTDGSGKSWEYKDSYAKRNNSTGPDAGFTEANWNIPGVSSLNGGGTCQMGSTFESMMGGIGTYSAATASVVENQIEGFSMYPNPAVDGSFTITSKSNTVKQVEIYSLLGNLVVSKSVKSNEKIDVSNLSSGFYMVKVEEEGKIATRKLLVK